MAALAGFVYWSVYGQPEPRQRSIEESAALRSVESIVSAQKQYKGRHGRYADRLFKLGPSLTGAPPSAEAAGLIPRDLAQGSKRLGYEFLLRGYGDSFELNANPIVKAEPPRAWFYADHTGAIRESLQGQATAGSPKVQ